MIRIISSVFVLLAVISCGKGVTSALDSNDVQYVLGEADKYFAQGKYAKAINVYEHSAKLVAGTQYAPDVAYKVAEAQYNNKNYKVASASYLRFINAFSSDARIDDAYYKRVKSAFLASPDYKLEQSSTLDALEAVRIYKARYPKSSNIEEALDIEKQLNEKLDKKKFETIKTYYNIGEYKASIYEANNVLKENPSFKNTEDLLLYKLRAQVQLSINSIYDLKEERINESEKMIEEYGAKYPEHADELSKMKTKLVNARKVHNREKEAIAIRKEKENRLKKTAKSETENTEK